MSKAEVRRSQLAISRVATVAVIILFLDQMTKQLAVQAVEVGEVKSLVPLIDLVQYHNKGIAFSSFDGRPWIVGLLVFAALAILAVWFSRNRGLPLAWLVTGLLAGGALGNVVDRLVHSYVIDFLKPPRWPAFNLADSAIVCGMIMLVVVVEVDHRRKQAAAKADADAVAQT